MLQKLTLFYSTAWRAALVLLTLQIAAVSVLRYLTGLEEPPPPIAANAFADPFLVLHVVGGVIALLVGPIQFLTSVRSRWSRSHRLSGRLYVIACAIGAPAGFMLALGATAGPIAGAGFAILALLWATFTWLGLRAAVQRRIDDHREWMIRSYAMTATAITLRLMLPASMMAGFEFVEAYTVIAWASWLTNLAIAEYVIRRKRAAASGFIRLAAA